MIRCFVFVLLLVSNPAAWAADGGGQKMAGTVTRVSAQGIYIDNRLYQLTRETQVSGFLGGNMSRTSKGIPAGTDVIYEVEGEGTKLKSIRVVLK